MKNTNADQVAQKWATNVGNAGQSVKDGVTAVTENPADAAIRQKELLRQRFLEALDSGKWEEGLRRTSLADWKTAMLGKGLSRMQQGAAAAKGKVQAFQSQWLPYIRGAAARIKQMPKGGIANAMARIQANLEAAKAFKRS